MQFQELIGSLHNYWASRGCAVIQPWDIEKGAGTFNSATYLRTLGPEPWKVAYVEPSRRPTDGRYGDNPNRLERHHQFQVLLKPSPKDIQQMYLDSLQAIGIDPLEHDIRFVEDNWESPTLGAWGLGWEVWCDGMEITQFTYFQQCGGHNLDPISVELTYGLERIAMYLQNRENVYDLDWGGGLTYGDMRHAEEYQWSKHNFESASVELYLRWFSENMQESARLCKEGLVIPAYDYCLRCSHIFNILDARGAISVAERQAYILRVRETSKMCADAFLADREAKGFPLCQKLGKKLGETADEKKTAQLVNRAANRELPAATKENGTFLLEIGCEELPARLAPSAAKDLARLVEEKLNAWGLDPAGAHCEFTPRRLVVGWDSIRLKQDERVEEVKGPPVRIACVDGKPGTYTPVGEAFLKKLLPGEDVAVFDSPKGPYLGVSRKVPSRNTAELLAEALPALLAKIHWPKPMRWDGEETPFGRPVHWIVCCLDGEIVPFEFAGVQSGNQSVGHRFHFPEPFAVRDWAELEKGLGQRKVILSERERKENIREAVHRIAGEVKGKPVEDEALLDEIANIVEWPQPILGSFSRDLLILPRQVIVTPMRVHQRYFPVEDESGALLPHFIIVAGTEPKDAKVVAAGNAKVLKARLEDARFFYERDVKIPLADRLPSLGSRIWLANLGSVRDKVERIRKLVNAADGDKNADRAAELCKCDLATSVVGEFPELQGQMGRIYALKQGETPEVADALYESYLPRFSGDVLPKTLSGTLVALADRFDSIAGCFGIGLKPTGNQDPYALRRQCIGILQIMTHTEFPIKPETGWWIGKAAEGYGNAVDAKCASDISDFFADRMRHMYSDVLPADVVEAVVAAGSGNPKTVYAKIKAVAAFLESGQLDPVLTTFKRVANITRDCGAEEASAPLPSEEEAERNLSETYQKCSVLSKKHLEEGKYGEVLSMMGELRPQVDRYFEDLLVMHEDPRIRASRLGLLCRLRDMFAEIADFTKIQDRKK